MKHLSFILLGKTKKFSVAFVCFPFFFILLMYTPALTLNHSTYEWLVKEDGIYEYFGAILFFFASINFFLLYLYSSKKPTAKNRFLGKNYFYLVLGALFFVGFGEEISWGQRILKFDIPDLLDKINAQSEFNIHNLNIFHGIDPFSGTRKSQLALMLNLDRLFSFFWFSFCFLIPLITRYNRRASFWILKSRFPVTPLPMGILFPINYLFSKIINYFIPFNIVEVKEANFAFLFLMVSIFFLKQSHN